MRFRLRFKQPFIVTMVTLVGCGAASGSSHQQSTAPHEATPSIAQPRSTLDPRIQAIAREELGRAMEEWSPVAAVAIVINPKNGQVLAMEGRVGRESDPSIAETRAYVTGSTLKIFTLAAALEAKTIEPNAMVDCRRRAYGPAQLYDGVPRESLSVTDVLVTSSNVGTSRVYDTLGLAGLLDSLKRFHFGEAPGEMPLPQDGTGMEAAMLAIGESAKATPLQVAAGYAAIWNDGMYFAPTTTSEVRPGERVLSADTARTLAAMLEAAVASDLGTGKLARIDGARVAGKTGTAQIDADGHVYSSFVGTLLDHGPSFVTLVGLESPKEGGSGPKAAAPLFARIAQRIAGPRSAPLVTASVVPHE